jgi:hypothetical protein
VRPEILQIDSSAPAVRFSVIEQPNELVKAATLARGAGDLSEGQQLQLEFWSEFRKRLLEKKVMPSAQTARPQYWFDVALGRTNIHLSNTLNTWDGKLGVRVYLHNPIADEALRQLLAQKDAIEAEIGCPLQWNPNPTNRDKIIAVFKDVDLTNRANWADYVDWLVEMTAKFRAAFVPRVKLLELKQATAVPIL